MQDKREMLVRKATELFAQGGYTAVGIDRIIAETGIAKMTMYKHFKSKADLIMEVLVQRDCMFRESLMAYVSRETTVHAQIHALFAWHEVWFRREDFNGCMFLNASAEFHDRDSPMHKISALHKQLIIDFIESLLIESYGERAHRLALQISMLVDGAIDAAHVVGNLDAAMQAWEAAEQLIGPH